MNNDLESILLAEERIHEKVSELAERINADYEGLFPMFIGVLKGSFMFMADLVRKISLPCEVEFMAVSSYGSRSESTGAVKITRDLSRDIENRHIIVVEDILDSGLTLNYLLHYLKGRNPASVKLCTLLDKPDRRKAEVHIDYLGYRIPDAFVVGYGLDYAEKYRNLPYIGILKPEIYENE